MYNKTYNTPCIEVAGLAASLLSASGPEATSIGSPNVSNECKSVWDEVNEQYNIKEEQNYGEDWI